MLKIDYVASKTTAQKIKFSIKDFFIFCALNIFKGKA